MKKSHYKMKETIFIYPAETACWYCLPITKKYSNEIRENYAGKVKGFGSLPVTVQIGKSKWDTSIFYTAASKAYFVPVKAAVRRAEDIDVGERVSFEITLRV